MKKLLLSIFAIFISIATYAQSTDNGEIHGNFQADMQSYTTDSTIGATAAPEKVLLNSYSNITYTKGNFTAGVRFEGYMNTLQGYDERNNAVGIPYRFLSYKAGELEITVGNFYEQFGNGLIFRTYEDKTVDYDNAMEGIRIKYNVLKGIYLKGVIGRQRNYFTNDKGSTKLVNGVGLVRGIDAEISINEVFTSLAEKQTQLVLGGSFVSKFQEGEYLDDGSKRYKLPQNVGAYAARFNLSRGKINLFGEYAYKINDPNRENNYIYKNGEALCINATYSQKGLGVLLAFKRADNISYRSDRVANLNSLNINYLPSITKNHVYSLLAMYPYSTQPNSEIGFAGELMYKFKANTFLGGKYGTNFNINFSKMNGIKKTAVNDTTAIDSKGSLGYKSDFFAFGNKNYQDFNIEINKKINANWKVILIYQNAFYNYTVMRGITGHENVKTNTAVADITYKFGENKAIRTEIQALFTKQDQGDWALWLLEYSVSPHWFLTVYDQYNYGNEDKDKQIHYFAASFAYISGGNRIQIGYGKQRSGVVCTGGVCRNIPASNGITLSISSSF